MAELGVYQHHLLVRASINDEENIGVYQHHLIVRTNIDPPPPSGYQAQIGFVDVEHWLAGGDRDERPPSGALTLTGAVPLVEIK